tara:strand:+ start:76 stop:405 length:330 start_codon:yes stop_codon:yes gene_type:complete
MPNKNKKAAPKMRSSMEMRSAMEMKTPMEMRSAMEMNSPVELNESALKNLGFIKAKTLEKNPNATEMVVDGKKMPIKMQGSPYKMYGQDVSPNTVQGGSPLAKYGITTK